jgi:hypothetical protein
MIKLPEALFFRTLFLQKNTTLIEFIVSGILRQQLVPFVGAVHTVLRTVPKPLEHCTVENIAGFGRQ